MLSLGICMLGGSHPYLGRIKCSVTFFFMVIFPSVLYIILFHFLVSHQDTSIFLSSQDTLNNQHIGHVFSPNIKKHRQRRMLHDEGHCKQKQGEPQYLLLIIKYQNLPMICSTCNDINKSEQNQGYLHENILAFSRVLNCFSQQAREVALLLAFPARLFNFYTLCAHVLSVMIS